MHAQILARCALPLLLFVLCGAEGHESAAPSPAQLEQQREDRRAHRARVDLTMLRAQPRENGWAKAMEAKLGASLDEVRGLDVQVREVHCAATACRVVLDHRSLSGQQDVTLRLAGRPGFDLAGFAHLEWEPDGSAVSYLYVHGSDDDGLPEGAPGG